MRARTPQGALCVALTWSLALGSGCLAQEMPPPPPPSPPGRGVRIGGLELSGAARVEGGLLVVDDEQVGMLIFVPDAQLRGGEDLVGVQIKLERRRRSSRPFTDLPRLFAVQDLEDLESDGEDTVYVLGSHAGRVVPRGVEPRPDREFLIRAKWDLRAGELRVRSPRDDGEGKEGIYRGLLECMRRAAPRALAKDVMVNAEGLALKGKKRLFVGLRSPLGREGEALVFEAQADALFGDEEERRGGVTLGVLRLDLGGAGVRALHWDRKRDELLVLSGPTGDGARVPFRLWRCDAKGEGLEKVHTFSPAVVAARGGPEGVCRLNDTTLIIACDREGRAGAGVVTLER